MSAENRKSSKKLSRRSILGLSLAGVGAVGLSILSPKPTDLADRHQADLHGSPSHPPYPDENFLADPNYLTALSAGASIKGHGKTFKRAYSILNVNDVIELRNFRGSAIPWIAASIVGKNNELQIVDMIARETVYVLNLPEGAGNGIDSMVWNERKQRLYLSVDSGVLVWDPKSPHTISPMAKVAGGAALYSLTVDEIGQIWGGCYPLGSVFRIDPDTLETKIFPRLADDSDYVRSLAIDKTGRVWAGTGSQNPRVFTFEPSAPAQVREIPLPKQIEHGFVGRLDIVDQQIAASVSYIESPLFLDTVSNQWSSPVQRIWSGRIATPSVKGYYYSVSDGYVYATSIKSHRDKILGRVYGKEILQIISTVGRVLVVSGTLYGLLIESIELSTNKDSHSFSVALSKSALGIHSLMGHSDGKVYLGGFMGAGLISVNPEGGETWNSRQDESSINQIEGMIEFDAETSYIGSYGYADIISVKSSSSSQDHNFSRIARLSQKYSQSRPFGWAANDENVFFGTVPEYGVAGGVLGMIDPQADELEWVMHGNGDGFIRHHSIIGLIADSDYLYGTTSISNGLGATEGAGAGKVFKMHIATKKVLWEVSPIVSAGALYAPALVNGMVAVADLQGIVFLDATNGSVRKRHVVNDVRNASFKAGWRSADLIATLDGSKMIHTAAGYISILDFSEGKTHRVVSQIPGAKYGPRLTRAANGNIYGTFNDTDLVELSISPDGVLD
ncbi:hypothetical protein M2368_001048 [Arthrobacter sp. JUb119]|nr:hypothetical protein [Arthrobacter sp. JUb119]